MRKLRQFWRFADGLDAAHQDREVTHLTQACSLAVRQISRVRSEYESETLSISRAILESDENTRRVRDVGES